MNVTIELCHGWCGEHNVLIEGEVVASYALRSSALRLVNKLLKANYARQDLHTDGVLTTGLMKGV
jgi:hypothetical protein